MFRFSRKFSAGTTQKVVFHFLSNRILGKRFVNGKQRVFPTERLNTYLSDALPVTVCLQWTETPVQDNHTVLHSALEIWSGNAWCDQEYEMYSQPGDETKKQ